MSVNHTFPTSMLEHGDSKIILIERGKITNNSNKVIKKETLLVIMIKSLRPLTKMLHKP